MRRHRLATIALWVVFSVLIVILGYTLLKACGVRVFGREIAWCETGDLAGRARIAGLTLELAAREQQYRQRPLCGPSGPGASLGLAPGGPEGMSPIPDPRPSGTGSAGPASPGLLPLGLASPSLSPPGSSSQGNRSGNGSPAEGMAPGATPAPGGNNDQPSPPAASTPPYEATPPGDPGNEASPQNGANGENAEAAGTNGNGENNSPTPPASDPSDGAQDGAGTRDPDNAAAPPPANAEETTCVPDQPRDTKPVILALDHSRSMALPIDIDDQHATELESLIESGGPGAISAREVYNGYINQPGLKRLDVLKAGVGEWVDALPEGTNVGLVTFAGCDGIVDAGVFPPAERGSLKSRVEALAPKPATPVAQALKAALARAGGMRSNRIVLVTDGHDTCGGDPCQVARSSRGVRVDVLAMGGGQALSCIAEATGGRLIESSANQTSRDLLTQIETQGAETCE